MATPEDIKQLFAEFPEDAISWRAQSVTKAGDKAMALAYIDARDVMDRLDQICGAADWQDRYEFHGSRTICYLSIRVDGEWITKADGAGDSDVEAEKGAISDALKRAAVKWGIGRYLYSMPAPWVPCETAEWNGKKQWKRWTANPWDFVKRPTDRTANSMRKEADARGDTLFKQIDHEINECVTTLKLDELYKVWVAKARKDNWPPDWKTTLMDRFSAAKKKLSAPVDDDTFPGDPHYVSTLQAG
jgi:hypothetical protein